MTNTATKKYIDSIKKTNKFKRYIAPWIPLLSLLIIITVFWCLKLTGITLAGEAFCGIEEHVHTDSCYNSAELCAKEEHVHTALCYSDLSADLETQETWEASISSVELTDNLMDNIVKIARTQVGYAESRYNFILSEEGERLGYTRYGEWYGNPYGKWSSMFAAFVLNYAGLPDDLAPYNSGVETMRLEWQSAELIFKDGYMPTAGDIIFFDKDGNGSADSVGVISAVSGDSISVIEGDLADAVAESRYSMSEASVMGYGSVIEILRSKESEEDLARVDQTIEIINTLPSLEEVENTLLRYEEAEDFDGYVAYMSEIGADVKAAYVQWEDLENDLRGLVTNYSKVDQLNWTWMASVYPNARHDSAVVYQINYYSASGSSSTSNTIIYGGTIKDKLKSSMSYTYWDAVFVKWNSSTEEFYVSQYETADVAKSSYKAPSGGFILLVYKEDLNIQVGDIVTIGWNYKKTGEYDSSGYGRIYFNNPTNDLKGFIGVDTSEFIKLNLYNYGNNCNDKYESNKKYPGFQQSIGTSPTTTALNQYAYNFGDNVTKEYAEGQSGITKKSEAIGINRVHDVSNEPISYDYLVLGNGKIMRDTLLNGYPAMADGTSLDYLFRDNVYATQANDKNITGLFQYNSTTGEYYFDSRNNHAQFDAATDTFTLYNELITPNYIYYPFGNFLPFNDIITESTQTTKMNRTWFVRTARAGRMKYLYGSASDKDKYQDLYSAMDGVNDALDAKYTDKDWNYLTLINDYFGYSATPDLPGNDADTKAHLSRLYNIDYDEETDFFFGMDMELEFMQPKGGMTGIDGNQPMVYEFRGDDDVWVYIDDVLFLDLSGIHRHVGGKIDFVNGKVYYYALDTDIGDVDTSNPFATVDFKTLLEDAGKSTDVLNSNGTFNDYSEHTMKFFYMERGAGSSVCSMKFNMPLLRNNSINVIKELEGEDASSLGNPDFAFQIWKENGKELLIGENVEYSVMNQNGAIIRTGKTGANGIFTIKAGERAIFTCPENAGKYFVRELLNSDVFEQYDGVITVDGSAVTTNSYTDVTIDDVNFTGLNSPVKDISDGGTTFIFQNKVVANKYGSMTVKKTANEYGAAANKAFTFTFTVDGVPVPVGTSYTLISADGIETPATITTAGELILHAGETARFDKILAGTKIKIVESDASSQGYRVNYEAVNLAPPVSDDTYIEGIVAANTDGIGTSVIISNDRNGTKLDVGGTKTLLYSDGGTHTFNIILAEISSPDNPVYNGGVYLTQTVTLGGTANESFTFTLNFPPEDVGTSYYLIYEDDANAPPGRDKTKYILAVTTELQNGEVVITEKKLLKDGVEAGVFTFDFVNENLCSLTVSKTVEGEGTGPFGFDIELTLNGQALSGEFETSDGGTVIFVDGKATLSLSGGETITLYLPYGTAWTVTETVLNGYVVRSGKDVSSLTDSNSVSGDLNGDAEAYFLNISAPELPSTGGYGQTPWILSGFALMLGSLVLAYISRRRTKGGKRQPS